MKKPSSRLSMFVLGACLLAMPAGLLTAQATAFLGVANATKDPRLDYLAPIIEGTLLYDLSVRGNLVMVERTSIDKVLREQDFQLAGLTDPAKASAAGKILNADWLLAGSYSLAGSDVFASFTLTDTETGTNLTFTDRGTGENLIHRIAERVIQRLAKRSVELASDDADRSILSLRDERPGSLVLYSRMVNAKIFIDGEFAGFTLGKEQTGIPFDGLPPGRHRISTHLDNSFGVVDPVGLGFHDWDKVVDIKPGRRLAVLDETADFPAARERLMTLSRQRASAAPSRPADLSSSEEFRFTDAGGAIRVVRLTVSAPAADNAPVRVSLRFDGQEKGVTLAFPADSNQRTQASLAVGGAQADFTLIRWANELALDRVLVRTDIPELPRRVVLPAPAQAGR